LKKRRILGMTVHLAIAVSCSGSKNRLLPEKYIILHVKRIPDVRTKMGCMLQYSTSEDKEIRVAPSLSFLLRILEISCNDTFAIESCLSLQRIVKLTILVLYYYIIIDSISMIGMDMVLTITRSYLVIETSSTPLNSLQKFSPLKFR
jgi:hypothetical protein